MTGSGSDSELSKSVNWDLDPYGDEEEMAVCMALRRTREEIHCVRTKALGSVGAGGSRRMPVASSDVVTTA